MARRSPLRTILRRAIAPAVLLIIVAVFGGYAVLGPNGAVAYGDIKRQQISRSAQLAVLDKKRAVLKNKVALLDPRHADPDMVDELVRKDLNVAHPDEVIVPLTK